MNWRRTASPYALAYPAPRPPWAQGRAGQRPDAGVAVALVLSCVWLTLCFLLLVLLIPTASVAGLLFRLAIACLPIALLWVLYFAGQSRPVFMTALLIAIVVVTELSARNRALSDVSADPQNMVKLAIWGTGLLVALLNWRHLRAAMREPPVALLLLLSLWFTLTAVYSPIRTYSFGAGVAFLSVVAFGAVARRVVPGSMLLKGVLGALTIMLCISLVMYVLVPQRAMALMEGGNILRLAAPFGSPNSLGRVAATVILLGLVSWWAGALQWRSPLLVLGVPAALACLYLSQSRTAMLALVAALAIVYLLGRPVRVLLAGLLLTVAAMAIVLTGFDIKEIAALLSRSGRISEVTTLTGRTEIWAFVWGEIKQAPWFGYGNASTKYYLPLLYHTFWGWTTTHAHNMWLQIWFTTGLVGVSLLAATFVAQFRSARRRHDLVSLAVLVFVFVIGMAEAGHIDGAPSVLTVVWAVWLAGNPARSAERRPAKGAGVDAGEGKVAGSVA